MSFRHTRGGQVEEVTPHPDYTEDEVKQIIAGGNFVSQVHPDHVYIEHGKNEPFAQYRVVPEDELDAAT